MPPTAEVHHGLPVIAFATLPDLHAWLLANHDRHSGVWVRLRRSGSRVPSVTFTNLLEEGLCFGWSESTRHAYDADFYLQRFAPRRMTGTTSERNRRLAASLITQGRMTAAGLARLGLTHPPNDSADLRG